MDTLIKLTKAHNSAVDRLEEIDAELLAIFGKMEAVHRRRRDAERDVLFARTRLDIHINSIESAAKMAGA